MLAFIYKGGRNFSYESVLREMGDLHARWTAITYIIVLTFSGRCVGGGEGVKEGAGGSKGGGGRGDEDRDFDYESVLDAIGGLHTQWRAITDIIVLTFFRWVCGRRGWGDSEG